MLCRVPSKWGAWPLGDCRPPQILNFLSPQQSEAASTIRSDGMRWMHLYKRRDDNIVAYLHRASFHLVGYWDPFCFASFVLATSTDWIASNKPPTQLALRLGAVHERHASILQRSGSFVIGSTAFFTREIKDIRCKQIHWGTQHCQNEAVDGVAGTSGTSGTSAFKH